MRNLRLITIAGALMVLAAVAVGAASDQPATAPKAAPAAAAPAPASAPAAKAAPSSKSVPAATTEPRAKPQSTCPVSGEPIDTSVSTIYDGQKVYFCCPKCPPTFEKDPEKYLAKLGEQGQIVESLQKLCPVSGDPIDPKVFVDYKGRRVFFCCNKCPQQFQADPAKYLPLLGRTEAPAGAGRHDAKTPQGGKTGGHDHGGGMNSGYREDS